MRFYENVWKLHNCHSFAKNTKCLSLTSQMCRIGYFLVVSSPFIHYVQLCVCRRVRHDHFSYQNRNCNQTGRLTNVPWRRQVNLTSSCKQFFSFFFFYQQMSCGKRPLWRSSLFVSLHVTSLLCQLWFESIITNPCFVTMAAIWPPAYKWTCSQCQNRC